jgi:hypothetical protein
MTAPEVSLAGGCGALQRRSPVYTVRRISGLSQLPDQLTCWRCRIAHSKVPCDISRFIVRSLILSISKINNGNLTVLSVSVPASEQHAGSQSRPKVFESLHHSKQGIRSWHLHDEASFIRPGAIRESLTCPVIVGVEPPPELERLAVRVTQSENLIHTLHWPSQ